MCRVPSLRSRAEGSEHSSGGWPAIVSTTVTVKLVQPASSSRLIFSSTVPTNRVRRLRHHHGQVLDVISHTLFDADDAGVRRPRRGDVGRGGVRAWLWIAEAAPGVREAERVGERVNDDVVAEQGTTEAPPWRTIVRWIVLHPDRDAVLVIDGGASPALPSAELSSAVWLGDAPALTGALAELGVDAVLLGCRGLRDDPQNRVQHLTMMALPRPGSVDAPLGTRWVEHEEVKDLLPAGAGGGPHRASAVGGAQLVPGHRRVAA